jgi:chemotaxis protein CheD
MTAASATQLGPLRVVGIGQLVLSADPRETIITYALGSCLGVTAYDRVARVGALVHVQLPMTPAHAEEAAQWPAKFVETGVAQMFRDLYARGARKERVELRVAGGARTTGEAVDECFEIGRRNIVALKKVLWQNGVLLKAHDVGGTAFRTISLRIDDGMVVLATQTASRPLGGDLCP